MARAALVFVGFLQFWPCAAGRRLIVEGPGVEAAHALFSGSGGLVCGGTAIRDIVAGDSSVERVRNLPWSKVLAITTEFIASEGRKIDVLQVEVAGLQEQLKKAIESEKPRSITVDEVKSAVEAAVGVPTSYGSIDKAKTSKCGAVLPARKADRPPAGAYEAAEEAIVAALEPLLSGGMVSPGDAFSSICAEHLGSSAEGDVDNFCNELCQAFADRAAAMAGDVVASGSGSSSSELAKQVEAKENELKLALARQSECKTAQTTLNAFQLELGGLATVIKQEMAKVMAARRALQDAEGDLEELNDDLAEQDKVLQSLAGILAGTGAELSNAQALVAELTKINEATAAAVKVGEADLQQANAQVKRASEASQAAQELRAQLSSLLLKISLYVDAAVRNPIRDLGLGETVDVKKFFPDPLALNEAEGTGQSINALDGFCKKAETVRAFTEMQSAEIDSLSLCNLGAPASGIVQEINDVMKDRVVKVTHELESVQSWLNPLKGQDKVTLQDIDGYVKQGEPEGLRSIIAIMDHTEFYTHYLTYWKADEKFVTLYNNLKEAVTESEAQHAQAQEALSKLQGELQAGIEKRNQALEALKVAMESNQVAEGNLAQARLEYDTLVGQQKAMEDKLAKLKAAMEAAEKAYQEARQALQQAHQQGTALLELLQALKEVHDSIKRML